MRSSHERQHGRTDIHDHHRSSQIHGHRRARRNVNTGPIREGLVGKLCASHGHCPSLQSGDEALTTERGWHRAIMPAVRSRTLRHRIVVSSQTERLGELTCPSAGDDTDCGLGIHWSSLKLRLPCGAFSLLTHMMATVSRGVRPVHHEDRPEPREPGNSGDAAGRPGLLGRCPMLRHSLQARSIRTRKAKLGWTVLGEP